MALGRGLSELLSEVEIAYDNSSNDTKSTILEIDIDLIKPNPNQPRKVFNEDKLKELSDSIVKHGLLQPIIVTRDGDEFILIAGERRTKASKIAKLSTIKAIIFDIEDSKLRELALIENIQRDDLNIIELAYSYAGLLNEKNITHEELAKLVSKSRSVITNTLRLLSLSVYTQQMLGSTKITAGHAKILIGLSDKEQRIIVDSVIGQKLSVRETEKLVKDIKSKEEDVEVKIKNISQKLDFEPLKNIINKFKDNDLRIKMGKDHLKIELNSNDDIEKLLKFF